MRILFICGRNRWRSPTAEQIFSAYPGVECDSAGVSKDAENPVTPELLEWAEIVFVMEKTHQAKLAPLMKAKTRVICLNIPDQYRFMDPKLVKLLKDRVTHFLPST